MNIINIQFAHYLLARVWNAVAGQSLFWAEDIEHGVPWRWVDGRSQHVQCPGMQQSRCNWGRLITSERRLRNIKESKHGPLTLCVRDEQLHDQLGGQEKATRSPRCGWRALCRRSYRTSESADRYQTWAVDNVWVTDYRFECIDMLWPRM